MGSFRSLSGAGLEALGKDLKLAEDAKAFRTVWEELPVWTAPNSVALFRRMRGWTRAWDVSCPTPIWSMREMGAAPRMAGLPVHAGKFCGDKSAVLTLEINRVAEADLEASLKAPELAFYKPWLRDVRAFREHQLSDEIEEKLHEKSVTGKSAWVRLFDETFARLRFALDGEQLTSAEVLDKLSHKDGAIREKAAKSFASVLKENISLFALLPIRSRRTRKSRTNGAAMSAQFQHGTLPIRWKMKSFRHCPMPLPGAIHACRIVIMR